MAGMLPALPARSVVDDRAESRLNLVPAGLAGRSEAGSPPGWP